MCFLFGAPIIAFNCRANYADFGWLAPIEYLMKAAGARFTTTISRGSSELGIVSG